jgi:hypothetical protein
MFFEEPDLVPNSTYVWTMIGTVLIYCLELEQKVFIKVKNCLILVLRGK